MNAVNQRLCRCGKPSGSYAHCRDCRAARAADAREGYRRRPLAPKGGNDRVYTPDDLAARIVAHFKPEGRILEPCRGGGAFTRAMPFADWCEIDEGRDFYSIAPQPRYDWVITNPPWSQFRPFLFKSMQVGNNVVFLSLLNAFFMRARVEDARAADFGYVEIVTVPTPPKPWPQTGFQLAVTHLSHGYRGPCKFTHW